MKSVTPFFYRYTILFFEFAAVCTLVGFGLFMYQNFYTPLISPPTEEIDPAQQVQTLNIGLYETVQEQHEAKIAQANVFEGYIITNPFHSQEKTETSPNTSTSEEE